MNDAKRAWMGRLKWHSRRALLELDIVLQRYWQTQGDELDDRSAAALTRLLALEDHDMWDIVSGRVDVDDPELGSFIRVLRANGGSTFANKVLMN